MREDQIINLNYSEIKNIEDAMEKYKKFKIRKLIKEIYRLFKLSFMSDNVFELPRIFVVITVVFKFSLCVLQWIPICKYTH